MQNRLMTIMFLDMQGYTKRSAQQTIEEMKLFHDQMFKFVSEIIEKYNGRMVKSLGDGFLVCYESPTMAVQAGIEIQRRLESRNAQMMNPESLVRFRIGINTGEVGVDENGDLFGDPVNIASRIQTFADTNDVFISESTFLAMNRNEFGAVDLGAQELKNATREIKIYKVLKNGSPGMIATQKAQAAEPESGNNKKKLAIAAVVLVVILLVTAGIVRGIRRKRAQQNHTNNQSAPAVAQSPDVGAPDKGNEPDESQKEDELKTILDLEPEDKRLKFTPDERKGFSDLQKLRKNKNFAQAEKIAAHMINTQPAPKKLPWALMLAELFFEQGKLDDAEKICGNILAKAGTSHGVRVKLIEQTNRLRKKYQR